MPETNTHDDYYKDRKSDRTPVDTTTQLRHAYSVEVKVLDLSTRGFMAQCPESIGIGSYISLDIPGIGPVHAQIRWQLGGKMGGMFLDPISLHRCEWTATKAAA